MSLYRFSTNNSQTVKFEKYYQGYVSDNATDNLKIASAYRDKVVTVMKSIQESRRSLPCDIINVLDEYLPYIATMVSQLTAADYLKVRKNPVMEWTSALSPRKDLKVAIYTYTSLADELVSAYVLYGMAHYQMAWFTLDGETKEDEIDPTVTKDDVSRSKDANTWLRKAAGIFSFVAHDLIPHLRLSAIRAPDIWKVSVECMCHMSLANAQERALFLAIEKGSKASTLAKLCLGLANKFDEAHTALTDTVRRDMVHMTKDFPNYLRTKSQYYAAQARKYLGIDANEREKYGERVTFLRLAKEIIANISCDPTDNPGLIRHISRCDMAKKEIGALYEEANTDNEGAYFQIVPSPKELEFPAGAFVVKPEAHVPHDLLETNFFDTDPNDKKNCIIS